MDASQLVALLGPTNTGKTHRAIERMLDFDSGMIGLPLRLLAREVYDKLTARLGESRVALVTGEEKRIPRRPDYWVATTEAMPLSREVDFVAVDEIQLAAHPQRGHVFTDRLLHARGRRETWFLGSDTMRGVLETLVPAAKVSAHPRFSKLSHAGSLPLGRVPPRSAVVCFSIDQVYAVAEKLRVLRGGAAVVLGALSPRTRNAQVAMFQSGEVDYLVATDAIGMGLNLDLRHVAFTSLRKFDGRDLRGLDPSELAQIAGRAGRYLQDGTFGAVAPLELPVGLTDAIEQHLFEPLKRVQWRRHTLDFSTVEALSVSLQEPPRRHGLARVIDADDTSALLKLAARRDVMARVKTPQDVAQLWEVCCIPDYRKLLFEAHVDFLAEIFLALGGPSGQLGDAFLEARIAPYADTEGDVESLVARIAAVRAWTYVSNQSHWLAHPETWQARTRALEDKLSDALHARLVLRFVDQPHTARSAAANARPRARTAPKPETPDLDPRHPFAALKGLKAAMQPAPQPGPEVLPGQWLEALIGADHARLTIDEKHRIVDTLSTPPRPLARLLPGSSPLAPELRLVGLDAFGGGARNRLHRRLTAWVRDALTLALSPLDALARESSPLRGIAYRLEHALGALPRAQLDDLLVALDDREREALAARGVRCGHSMVWVTSHESPTAYDARWPFAAVFWGLGDAHPSPRGAPSFAWWPKVPVAAAWALGYAVVAGRAVRVDLTETLRDRDPRALSATLRCSAREAERVLSAFAAERPVVASRPRDESSDRPRDGEAHGEPREAVAHE
ncbi:MAG: helicase [Myxococcales bacterium]|nr:helicase [Myxococcales bacterium]